MSEALVGSTARQASMGLVVASILRPRPLHRTATKDGCYYKGRSPEPQPSLLAALSVPIAPQPRMVATTRAPVSLKWQVPACGTVRNVAPPQPRMVATTTRDLVVASIPACGSCSGSAEACKRCYGLPPFIKLLPIPWDSGLGPRQIGSMNPFEDVRRPLSVTQTRPTREHEGGGEP